MDLKEYLSAREITLAAFAAKIGVSRMAVSRYCSRERLPSATVMRAIARVTDGQVTPNDFHQIADPEGSAHAA